MKTRMLTQLMLMIAMAAMAASAQTTIKGISDVFAQGKITGNQYKNDYFGLTLTVSGAHFTQGGFVNVAGKRARLIDAQCESANWNDKYEIAVLADALSLYPITLSPEKYLRSVRHGFEKEGWVAVKEESFTKIAGIPFAEMTMQTVSRGRTHYEAMYSTFLNGYVLSFQVEAPTEDRLEEIAQSMVRITSPQK